MPFSSNQWIHDGVWGKHTNIQELISFLVQSGRTFMTHHSHDQTTLPINHHPSPITQGSFWSVLQFPTVQDDYTHYKGIHANVLSLPWGCAAFLWGGIVLCLAIEVLGDCAEDVVINGPSDNVWKFGHNMYYNGNEFWDNGLNEVEMDLICGVYKLYSKNQIHCQYFITDSYFLQSREISSPIYLGVQNSPLSWPWALMSGIGHQIVNCDSNLKLRKYYRWLLPLLYFSHDLSMPHFSKFYDQIFKLQLLTHFLTDFFKTWTAHCPICNIYPWYIINANIDLF